MLRERITGAGVTLERKDGKPFVDATLAQCRSRLENIPGFDNAQYEEKKKTIYVLFPVEHLEFFGPTVKKATVVLRDRVQSLLKDLLPPVLVRTLEHRVSTQLSLVQEKE